MPIFQLNEEELLTFFAVLVRISVLVAFLPITGDRMVPGPVKILLSVAVSLVLYPVLVKTGQILPGTASRWAATPAGILMTVGTEAALGLVLGFISKLAFDVVQFAGNLAGTFMGFASASIYDPHQETQTQVVAELQMALAVLIFLAIDGHHLILGAALGSYGVVGLGKATFSGSLGPQIIALTGGVLKYGIQLSAPVAVSLFAVNIVFGVMAKAMPQINILVLSFAVTAMVGLVVMFLSMPQFQGAIAGLSSRQPEWINQVLRGLKE